MYILQSQLSSIRMSAQIIFENMWLYFMFRDILLTK